MQLETLPQLVCVCASLKRASRSVSRLYERALGPSRLSVPQFTLLYVLARQPLVQGMIAELLTIDRTTLTRTLAAMERRGLIRAQAGEDKRECHWLITPAGTKALDLARPRWEQVQEKLRTRLGVERWELLINELTNVAAAARMRALDGVHRFRTRKTPPPLL